jgi:peptide/nickel transport system ATP-binding protein
VSEVVVHVKDLTKYFPLKAKGLFSFGKEELFVKAVDGVTFDIHKGEILGFVGESGCGKTTVGRLLTRLETPTEGTIDFMGHDIAKLSKRQLVSFRRNFQMIFQDPYESLNPRFTVFSAVADPLTVHEPHQSQEERMDAVVRALEDAGLRPAEEMVDRYPHELSGGQRQRVAIARALVINPKCIVADEPVSMLDVSIRVGVMNLMLDLREKYGIPFLFITHDVAVARYMSDRIAVMYLGKVVEMAKTDDVIMTPGHPYTIALLSAVPVPDPDHQYKEVPIRGEMPSPINLPTGCRFHPRCVLAKGICRQTEPLMVEVTPGHEVMCHFAREIFGKESLEGLGDVAEGETR